MNTQPEYRSDGKYVIRIRTDNVIVTTNDSGDAEWLAKTLNHRNEIEDTNIQQKVLIEDLVVALKPFAEYPVPERKPATVLYQRNQTPLSVGDFVRAQQVHTRVEKHNVK